MPIRLEPSLCILPEKIKNLILKYFIYVTKCSKIDSTY